MGLNVAISISLAGQQEAIAQINRIQQTFESGPMREAVRSASRPVATQAKRNLKNVLTPPDDSGNLLRSFKIRAVYYRASRTAVAVVGTAWPEGAHGHLLEFGTVERFSFGGKGKTLSKLSKKLITLAGGAVSRGVMPARPFLRPALESTKREVESRLAATLKRAIDRAISKGRGA